MRKIFFAFLISLSFISPVYANTLAKADTIDLGGGMIEPLGVTEPQVAPVICDVNHETGSITITTTGSGPVIVTLTGLLTNTTIQRLFFGSTMILLPNADYYEIRVVLPTGEVLVGYFSITGS